MNQAERLAQFVQRASYDALSEEARAQIKIRILDAIGCAIGAVEADVPCRIRAQVEEFRPSGPCTLIGGGRTSPEQAAFYNGALVRYLDFNDSYLAKGETCHPSDNLAAVLAAAEWAERDGRALMTALAVAYQVQCRLSDEAPVRAKGFDHTTQGCYALAAGISKALGLTLDQTVNALAICGTAFNALRVTRTGSLSHWKGLAYAAAGFACTYATFLAKRGITGPREVFEGDKGFMRSIAGPFQIDWSREDLERVRKTVVKKYNAEIHSQSAVEGILELAGTSSFRVSDIDRIDIEIFDVAYHIIGGGDEGDKTLVRTKEQADHSLPYIVAAAILDGKVTPAQYRPERIHAEDAQALLRKVRVLPNQEYSGKFPEEMPCRITVVLSNGRRLVCEKRDYEGFHTRPLRWEAVVEKFESLSEPYGDVSLRRAIADAVAGVESLPVRALSQLLARLRQRQAGIPGKNIAKIPECGITEKKDEPS
jgi:2-methylcitrate dehydratase